MPQPRRHLLIAATIAILFGGALASHADENERKFGQALPWQPHHYGGSPSISGGTHTYPSYGRSPYWNWHATNRWHGFGYRGYGYGRYGYYGRGLVTYGPFLDCFPNRYYYPGPVFFPPAIVDSSRLYGLGPVARMTRPDPQIPRPVAQVVRELPQDDLVLVRRPNAQQPDIRVAVREANATSRAAAEKLMGFGIEHFRQGDYSSARRRFRDATRRAPDLAEAYLRWAFTAIALERYDEALTAATKAIGLDASLVRADLQLREMYADLADCEADRNRLAEAALKNATNADLLYLTAQHLYFSGEPDRAAALFQSALERGMPAEYVEPFLPSKPRDF